MDEEQFHRLSARAKTENRSLGSLIREAVDHVWTGRDPQKPKIHEELLAKAAMPVPEPQELARELEEIRGERLSEV